MKTNPPVAWRDLSPAKNAKWTVQKNYPFQIARWDGYRIEPLYAQAALEATEGLLREAFMTLGHAKTWLAGQPFRSLCRAQTLTELTDNLDATLTAIADWRKP